MHMQNVVKIHLVPKILSGNEITTSTKGHNSYKFVKIDL